MKINYYKLDTVQITQLIQSQDLKKYWIAEATGVHQSTFRRWLSGKIGRVSEPKLFRLAQVFAIDPTQIAQPVQ